MIKVNPIDYLHYKFDVWISYLSNSRIPEGGVWYPCILLTFNLLSVLNVIIGELNECTTLIGTVFGVCMAIYYLAKHEKIVAKYEMESDEASSKGTKAVLLYIVLTFVILYASVDYAN